MKHKVYKGILSLGIFLLTTVPMFAQSGVSSPSMPASPVQPKLAGRILNLNLNLEGQLARLDHALAAIEVNIAPKLAIQLDNIIPHINFEHNVNMSQPDGDSDNYVQASEKSKTLSKTYAVDAKDKLAINNQYGKVTINTWAKKEIKVDVEVKSFESSDSKAQEQLDDVSISESRQGDLISFKTNIDRKNVSWWSRTKNGKEEKRGVQVNYVVYMPAGNPLDITNRYGSTTIGDFSGPVNINSAYGSFSAKKLNNPANNVKVSYGSANIDSFSSGSLNVSYGSLKLTEADKLNAEVRYSSAKIGRLSTGGSLDLSYGSCKIETLDKNVKNLVVNSSYSGLTMGIDDAASFNFDVTVSYAGFNFNDDKVNITSRTPDEKSKGYNPTKNYKGTYGKGSDSRVIIKSNYGGVKFL